MSQLNGKTIHEEIAELQERNNSKAHYMMLLKLSKMTIGGVSLYCVNHKLDLRNTVDAIIEFRRMPNNTDRLYYLEARKQLGFSKPQINY